MDLTSSGACPSWSLPAGQAQAQLWRPLQTSTRAWRSPRALARGWRPGELCPGSCPCSVLLPPIPPPALPQHSCSQGSARPRSRLLPRPWREGSPTQASCHPVSPQIYYREAGGQNATEKVKVLFLPETAVKLKNLTSHSRYLVSISAFNAAGDGPRSEPRPGRTHQAGRRGGRASASPLLGTPLRTASSVPQLCPARHGHRAAGQQAAPGP